MVFVRPEDYSSENPDPAYNSFKTKIPKRVLHFSDGILEEYSTDEKDGTTPPPTKEVDPSTLAWGPFFVFKTWEAGTSTLSFIDYMGENLAWCLGITTPRYYFETEEYKRRQANETKQAERQGWCDGKNEIVIQLKAPVADAQAKIDEV